MFRVGYLECWRVDPVEGWGHGTGSRADAPPRGIGRTKVLALEHTDMQLVTRMLRGEERAFEEFFGGHAKAVYRFAVSRLGRESSHAEELTQATLTKAISKLETYRGEAGLFAWLCTFCRYEIAAFYRHRRRGPLEVDLAEESHEIRAALESAADGRDDDPEASLRRKELADQVHASLDEIPQPYGDVLEWKYVDGLSARQIADRLGLGVKAAESVLTRARTAFRDRFTRRSARAGHASRRS